jgi:hypothetical protein
MNTKDLKDGYEYYNIIHIFYVIVAVIHEHRKSMFITTALNLMRINEIIFTLYNSNDIFTCSSHILVQLLTYTRTQSLLVHLLIFIYFLYYDN